MKNRCADRNYLKAFAIAIVILLSLSFASKAFCMSPWKRRGSPCSRLLTRIAIQTGTPHDDWHEDPDWIWPKAEREKASYYKLVGPRGGRYFVYPRKRGQEFVIVAMPSEPNVRLPSSMPVQPSRITFPGNLVLWRLDHKKGDIMDISPAWQQSLDLQNVTPLPQYAPRGSIDQRGEAIGLALSKDLSEFIVTTQHTISPTMGYDMDSTGKKTIPAIRVFDEVPELTPLRNQNPNHPFWTHFRRYVQLESGHEAIALDTTLSSKDGSLVKEPQSTQLMQSVLTYLPMGATRAWEDRGEIILSVGTGNSILAFIKRGDGRTFARFGWKNDSLDGKIVGMGFSHPIVNGSEQVHALVLVKLAPNRYRISEFDAFTGAKIGETDSPSL